jgi:hypothetical protein
MGEGYLAPSSQTVGSLLRTLWLVKPTCKIDLTNSQIGKTFLFFAHELIAISKVHLHKEFCVAFSQSILLALLSQKTH